MSEKSEPAATEQNPARLSHQRILFAMAAVVIVGAIACSIFVSGRFGLGFIIGGVLAFFNYFWLKNSLKRIFENAGEGGEKPSFLTGNYFLRYAAIGLFIYFVYVTDAVPIVAVLLGLGAFAAAILIEGLILVFSSISKREEF